MFFYENGQKNREWLGWLGENVFLCTSIGKHLIMAKKLTTKELRLRARAQKRRMDLRPFPQPKGVTKSIMDKNLSIIASLEKKVKAVAAKA